MFVRLKMLRRPIDLDVSRIWPILTLIILASLLFTHRADAQTFTWTGATNTNWKNAGNWTPTGGPPNAIGAGATFNPGTAAITDAANQAVTIGSITDNQISAGTAATNINASGTNILTFQNSSGDASITYQLGVGQTVDGTGVLKIAPPLQLNSPLDITSSYNLTTDNAINLTGAITGSQQIAVFGGGDVQVVNAGAGFTGPVAVNSGAFRETNDGLTASGNVTVNSGGQFNLGSGTVTDWHLGTGSVLNLNGAGKASGVEFDGALRFQNTAATANFDNPVSLQSTSTIFVNGAAGPPATFSALSLTQLVSGAGGLTKDGLGTLVLTQANAYGTGGTGTVVNAGTLDVTNTTGSATGAGSVAVLSGATLGGSGTIAGPVTLTGATLFAGLATVPTTLTLGPTSIDIASNLDFLLGPSGVAGAGVNSLTDVNGDLTLGGTLDVTALAGFGAGVYDLFNYTGALTYNGLGVALPAGFAGTIDTTSTPNQVLLDVTAVPEPSTLAIASVASLAGLMSWIGRRRRGASRAGL